jgi:hypothetical protein
VARRDVPIVDTARVEQALQAAAAVDAAAVAGNADDPKRIPQLIDEARVQAIERSL